MTALMLYRNRAVRLCALVIPTALLLLSLSAPNRAATDTATTATVSGDAASLGLGPVTPFTLPNGLRVLVAPSSAADLVSLDVWVGAGTRRETAANNGAAHFIEHLIFKGTPTRKEGEIDAAIEDLGGSLDAATSYDWAHFYVTVASADAPKALAVLSDAVMNASLRQEDMDVERSVILDERANELSSPEERTLQAVDTLAFPGHPYGRPLLGTIPNITNMTRQTVVDFYKAYYVPGNTTLVITGNITPDAGLALAKTAFGDWPARELPADKTPSEKPQPGIVARALPGGASVGTLTIGFHAPSASDQPDAWVMDVLLTWLGQGGDNKLQTDLLRKQKLVTSISADYLTQRDPGLLTVSATFSPGNLDAVRSGILSEITALRDTPLSPDDLASAKHMLLASYLFDSQTDSGRADALGFYETVNTYRYDTEYITHILSVTSAQVQSVARTYLDPQNYTLATLLPRANPVEASSLSLSAVADRGR